MTLHKIGMIGLITSYFGIGAPLHKLDKAQEPCRMIVTF
jgi:hypothetical protein